MNGTLKFVSPCAYLTALRFRGLLNGRFSSTKGKISLVALKKQKCLSQCRDKTRSSLAPLLHALKRQQYALLQAILRCLNPPRLREVLDAFM